MYTKDKSLRVMVQQWLLASPQTPVRVIRFERMAVDHRRYVEVEAMRPQGPIALIFFRHDDHTWCVVPQRVERPAMRAAFN
ncbi:hypothetical protein [Candidatus Burkholderia verschuerenii]|uniref:hypothetical protein n=1 Tax=Candidatus Burkholderia verschuerenii TaxID=242163 RepID=UPI00067D2F2A|nr:hypothetical protein [Candidatus Burkholderia verschuerenii]